MDRKEVDFKKNHIQFFHILGYQPREVQFAIVEQNPTLLNITLFPENNNGLNFKNTFKNGLNGLEESDGPGSDNR